MIDLQGKTVLITGVAGFVGSHLADAALASGASVIGVDNFITGRESNIVHLLENSNFNFIEADVITRPTSYLPQNLDLDIVLHFASPASPPKYQANPIATYLINTVGTHNLLQYIHERNSQTIFLFASTSEIYGDPAVHPQVESYWGNVNPNGIRSCYDEAKRLGETICGVHERDFGMDVRIVRIFNTYGPRINPVDGRIIPQFISESLVGKPLSIFGDGSQTRSFCYVSDLVEGILLMATKDGMKGKTINLGNPDEHTVLETAQEIFALINGNETQPELNFSSLPKDDPIRRKPDISLAKELLGWEPHVSFSDGLAQTIAYFRVSSSNGL